MFSLSNQIKPPDDDHQHQLQPQDCDNSFKPTFLYNSFEHTLDFTSNSWLPPIQSKKRKNDEEDTRVVQSTGRKDRHSKVRTARGPRDRRVRLSPRTAIQFYDVQDRLGYDRPSKAIDWLIKEAKSAIDDLNARTDPPFMADPFCQQGFLAPAGWPPSGGLEREPLQSSLIDDSIVENSNFSGFNFCDELLSVTASAALMKEDERPSSMASFLQYED